MKQNILFLGIWLFGFAIFIIHVTADAADSVVLTNAVIFPDLIRCEQTWFQTHYPHCTIASFGHAMNPIDSTNIFDRKQGFAVEQRVRFVFVSEGLTKQVYFTYRLRAETNIESVWTNYINHMTSSEAMPVWLLAFQDFKSTIYGMSIQNTLPYLIEQINDTRPINICLTDKATRVCDLDILEFLSNLKRRDLGESVSLGFPYSRIQTLPLATQLQVDVARNTIKNWWKSDGAHLLDTGNLIWGQK